MEMSPKERQLIVERELAKVRAQQQRRRGPWLYALLSLGGCLALLAIVAIAVAILPRVPVSRAASAMSTSTPYPTYTLAPTYTRLSTLAPTSTPQGTATPYPTYTPFPTLTPPPTSAPLPTYTPYPTLTSRPTGTAQPARTQKPSSPGLGPLGTLLVDHWRLEITAVHADSGLDDSRKVIVILGNVTNEGQANDTFSDYDLMLRDGRGRTYEHDTVAGWAAQDKYGTEYGASMNPGATEYIAVAFDVLASEDSFTIIPGSLVESWSGDVWFELP